jgi:hypothetical protein
VVITDGSDFDWQTWPEHPPLTQSVLTEHVPFVDLPQKPPEDAEGGCVCEAHPLSAIAQTNRKANRMSIAQACLISSSKPICQKTF